MNDPVLHVQMLGGFGLRVGERAASAMSSRPAVSLLAYLVLRRDRTHTRDLLAGKFWPDEPDAVARKRLSNALWQLNQSAKQIGLTELFDKTQAAVGFAPGRPVVVDVEEFEGRLDELERRLRVEPRSVGIDELTAVVDSYGGDLLAGHYDEWILDPRQKVRERWLAALGVLVRKNRAATDYESALRHALSLVVAEPLSEEWHQEVMRLYHLNGQPSAAERQFNVCRRALADELQVEPSAETVELLDKIRQEASAATSSLPVGAVGAGEPELPFIGRLAERSALVSRVNDVVGGKGGLVVVEGEHGIGKSRLLAEVARAAEWREVQVLTGRHTAGSALTPYEGLREALRPGTMGVRGERLAAHLPPVWLRQAATVLDGLQAFVEPAPAHSTAAPFPPPVVARPEEERWHTTEALVQVLLAIGQPKPALIVLEDIHWCDDDTMQVLVQIGDRLIDSNVLICLSYRRQEAQRSPAIWQGLAELEAKPGSGRQVLGPLDIDDVHQLVAAERHGVRMSNEQVAQVASVGDGNPYVILELLRSPVDLLEPAAPTEHRAADDDLLPGLHEILSRRIETASDEVRAVLEAVSAMSGPTTTSVVAAVVGLGRQAVTSALADAVERSFLVESSRGVEFAQEHTRRVVYEAIDAAGRRRIHGRIVDALVREQGVRVSQIAHHAWLAEQWQRAYQYHALAADSALKVNAFHTTAEHFAKADQAARACHMPDVHRLDDLFAQERVFDILGRRADQQALLDRMAVAALDPGASPADRLAVTQRQAWLMTHTDRRGEAVRLASEAVAPARAAGLGAGELLTIVGCARAWSGDMPGAIGPLTEAVAELRARGESEVAAQLMLGRTYSDLLQHDEARLHLEEAYEAAKVDNDPRTQVEALGHLATLYYALGLNVKAENAFTEALELARSIGYRRGEGNNLVNLAGFHLLLGRGGRALGLFAQADEVFAALGDGRGQAFVRLNGAELAFWILGDDEGARVQAEQAAVYFRSVGDTRREATCQVTLAGVDRRAGRRRLARRRLQQALRGAQATDAAPVEIQARVDLALVALDLGQLDEAVEQAEAARQLEGGLGSDGLVPVLLAIEARARHAQGAVEEAAELARAAVGLNRSGALLAHLAAWWCAEVLEAVGDGEAASCEVALAHQLLTRHLADLPEAVARAAWEQVTEHRAILEARERFFEEQIEVRLPAAEVPGGRPLENEDLVTVRWTVTSPQDQAITSYSQRRQRRILRLTDEAVAQGAVARISDLAVALDVSERTVKRDLSQLRVAGYHPVTRGGGAPGEIFPT
ncbi:MAG: AAA family ATPase [Acidimicrobiia bacterium]|nr:AAA family ATPase [Acidimicrobiia bacterium]